MMFPGLLVSNPDRTVAGLVKTQAEGLGTRILSLEDELEHDKERSHARWVETEAHIASLREEWNAMREFLGLH